MRFIEERWKRETRTSEKEGERERERGPRYIAQKQISRRCRRYNCRGAGGRREGGGGGSR